MTGRQYQVSFQRISNLRQIPGADRGGVFTGVHVVTRPGLRMLTGHLLGQSSLVPFAFNGEHQRADGFRQIRLLVWHPHRI